MAQLFELCCEPHLSHVPQNSVPAPLPLGKRVNQKKTAFAKALHCSQQPEETSSPCCRQCHNQSVRELSKTESGAPPLFRVREQPELVLQDHKDVDHLQRTTRTRTSSKPRNRMKLRFIMSERALGAIRADLVVDEVLTRPAREEPRREPQRGFLLLLLLHKTHRGPLIVRLIMHVVLHSRLVRVCIPPAHTAIRQDHLSRTRTKIIPTTSR